jgi:hypothetical protein
MKHRRNVEGLKHSAEQKRQSAIRRTDEAIKLLLREGRTINFMAVAETAKVSTAWLYREETIRDRILHLRQQYSTQIAVPSKERASSTSKDAVIEALRLRVKRQEEEIRELRKQLEVAYGLLYEAGIQTP